MQTFRRHQLIDVLEVIYPIGGLVTKGGSIEVLCVDTDIRDAANRSKGRGCVTADKVRTTGLRKKFYADRRSHALSSSRGMRGAISTLSGEM